LSNVVASPSETDGRSSVDAGANWGDQRGRNRVVALKIVATWACC